jgi:putative hydrolase of HD superfamily
VHVTWYQALVGDFTPSDPVTPAEKHRLEGEAMLSIKSTLNNSRVGQELYDLWHEYEEQKTKESRLLKDLDRLEMIVTAFEYEKSQGADLQSFWTATDGIFKHPTAVEIDKELRRRRAMLPARK